METVGLAVIGCGTTGRIRARLARETPFAGWLGLCDLKGDLAQAAAIDTGADFVTTDYSELLRTCPHGPGRPSCSRST